MVTSIHLTPELEGFAHGCVASGRFSDISEVVRSALQLLQKREAGREEFTAMLEATEQEAQREGTHTLNDILREMDEVIERNAQ
ncbi:MAG: type II toxin-antitoxin system ParD family antitoxin [Magnetococcales bacterium]|nr:type II toxin-antitoxin system ParD family antitoxin [Magnetococcales bacterium]